VRYFIFRNWIYLLVIFFTTLSVFIDLPKTFYQQDEWQTLGHNLAGPSGSALGDINLVRIFFGEGRPLSTVMYSLFLGYFKFTVFPSAIFAITFQALNSMLVFVLVSKITKNKLIALLSASFLIVNSVSHQAVTWVSANSTLPAATLILISLITYFNYLDKKERKYFYVSIISAILSLYFKGIGLFLFVLLPLLPFIYQNKSFTKKNLLFILKDNLMFLVFGFLMFAVRFISTFFRTEEVAGYASGGGSGSFIYTVFLRTILYPLTSLFQIFVPPLDLYSITPAITKMQYKFLVGSPLVDLVAQSIVADMIAIMGSILILFFSILMVHRSKDKIISRNVRFAIVFFFLSFLPYVALDRDSSYLSSRYFYVGLIPAGILFGYAVYFFTTFNKYIKWVTLFLVTVYLFHHAAIVRSDINHQVKLGNERVSVLNGIKTLYPNPSENTIFYVTSDKAYYGEVTNPFQNGLGYVLEAWYYDTGKIPKEFLSENFLWDLGDEGYKRSRNKGFGYYQDIDKMIKDMEKNNIKSEDVWAYFIKSKESEIVDITLETRERISTVSAIPK